MYKRQLANSENPKLAMMDALPDYDDLTVDESVYEQTGHSLNQKGLLSHIAETSIR